MSGLKPGPPKSPKASEVSEGLRKPLKASDGFSEILLESAKLSFTYFSANRLLRGRVIRSFRRGQEARTGAQNAAVGPFAVAARAGFVLGRGGGGARRALAEKNLAEARFLVEPARQQAEMILEFAVTLL